MLLGDLVTLAKAGFTPATVKELLTLSKEDPVKTDEQAEAVPKEETQPEPEKVAAEETADNSKDIADLKTQLEQTQKLLEEKTKALESLQKENTQKNNEKSAPTAKDQLNDIIRAFM